MMFTGLPVKFGSALSFWTAASAVTSPSLMTCDAWGVGRASQLNETRALAGPRSAPSGGIRCAQLVGARWAEAAAAGGAP